ncbi:hypothetical protein H8M03_00845 [Sphingomonas sabuli]|uniref:Uncharacterized protein n=1 Tax=Sphingomonas sabuli TaxID=2764186 RepID=A0A7G9L2U6_9SPHN|nr:hypothetical protein [Sphingomonas sabuli]QNM82945.1 hypothetical protein H8M03_00845 [Sphingomonas sabuli]
MSSAAVAEPPTGSRLGKRTISQGVALSTRDVAIGARNMADCMYSRHKADALGLLNAASADESRIYFRRVGGEFSCSSLIAGNDLVDTRTVSYPQDILRGIFAEEALQAMGASVAALQPLPLEQKRYIRPWFAATNRNGTVDEMAVCIADTNPAAIVKLVGTDPESSREDVAFEELTPTLGQCLVVGAKLQASRQALRAALADALYQRLRNPALSLPMAEAAAR